MSGGRARSHWDPRQRARRAPHAHTPSSLFISIGDLVTCFKQLQTVQARVAQNFLQFFDRDAPNRPGALPALTCRPVLTLGSARTAADLFTQSQIQVGGAFVDTVGADAPALRRTGRGVRACPVSRRLPPIGRAAHCRANASRKACTLRWQTTLPSTVDSRHVACARTHAACVPAAAARAECPTRRTRQELVQRRKQKLADVNTCSNERECEPPARVRHPPAISLLSARRRRRSEARAKESQPSGSRPLRARARVGPLTSRRTLRRKRQRSAKRS